jgi:3-dehydroquinate dehydratase I
VICVPVVGRTPEQARRQIDKAAARADCLELRMDLIVGGDLEELVEWIRGRRPDVKILVTAGGRDSVCSSADDRNRGAVEEELAAKGGVQTAEGEMLAQAVALGVDFVDAALQGPRGETAALRDLMAAQGGRTRLIVSHHDFHGTPSPRTLRDLMAQCFVAGAHIAKIVTLARRPADNLAVLGLITPARRRKRDIIAFCMGREGRMSRAVAPLLGSAMCYAALRRGVESAPGQFTVGQMRQILKVLGHGE